MTATVGWFGSGDAPVRRLRSPRRAQAKLVRIGLGGCVAVMAMLAVAGALVPPVAPKAVQPSPLPDREAAPAWIDIARPLQLFGLSGSPYARLPLAYDARRRPDGSARQDTLTFGSFAGPTPFLRLTLERAVRPTDGPGDLVVAAARLAGSAGIALTRAGQPDPVTTRFGLFSVAPVTLRSGAVERSCLGLQLQGQPTVAMAGLACGPEQRGPDRAELACAIDRLDLLSAGDDLGLRSFFTESERHRSPTCGTLGPGRS